MTKRTLVFLIMVISLTMTCGGCGKERPQVSLSIWTSAEEHEIMKEMIEKGIIERVGGRKIGKWIKK